MRHPYSPHLKDRPLSEPAKAETISRVIDLDAGRRVASPRRLQNNSERTMVDIRKMTSKPAVHGPNDSNELTRPHVLNSWKEIAAYLGRGVRTVQRWEADLALPVHRPRGRDRSTVVAMPQELDGWLNRTPLRNQGDGKAYPEKLTPEIRSGLLALARDLLSQGERLAQANENHPDTEDVIASIREIVRRLTRGHDGDPGIETLAELRKRPLPAQNAMASGRRQHAGTRKTGRPERKSITHFPKAESARERPGVNIRAPRT